MRRRTVAWILAGSLAAATGALVFLAATTTGARWLVDLARALAPGDLQVAQVNGRLIGPLEIGGLRYRSPAGASIRVGRLALDWRPRALFDNTVHITHLSLDRVRVRTAPGPGAPRRPPPHLRVPVKLVVDRAQVRGLTWERPGARALHLDAISLRLRAGPRRIDLAGLDVTAPQGTLALRGTLIPRAPYRVDLHNRWTLHLSGRPTVTGHGRIHGDRARVTLAEQVEGGVRARVDARVDGPLGGRSWRARIRLLAFDPRDWRKDWPQARVAGRVHAQGRGGRSVRLSGTVAGAAAAAPPLLARFYLAYADGRWRLAPLIVTAPGGPRLLLAGEGSGGIRSLHGTLEARWSGLAWPLTGAARWRSPRGDLHIAGSARDYRVQLETQLAGAHLPESTWRITGRGNAEGMRLQTLEAELLGGRLTGAGRIGWRPQPALDLDLHAAGLDPGRRWRNWPGRLGGDLTLSAALVGHRPKVRLKLDALRGTLRKRPVRGALQARLDGGEFTLTTLSLRVADARAHAAGTLGTRWDLDWRLRAPDLAALLPDSGGRLDAQGSLRGPRASPRVAAVVDGRDLHVGADRVKGLAVRIDAGLRADQPVSLQFRAVAIEGAQLQPTDLTVRAAGTAARQRWTAQLRSRALRVEVAAVGGRDGALWRGRLERADLLPRKGDAWHLAGPVDLALGATRMRLAPACWSGAAGARVCLQAGARRGHGWDAAAKIRALPLPLFDPLLEGGARLTGTLAADARFAAPAGGAVHGSARLQAGPGALTYPAAAGQGRVGYRRLEARLDLAPDRLQARAGLTLEDGGRLHAEFALAGSNPRASWRRGTLAGAVQARLHALGWISALFPQIQAVHGSLAADLRLAGRVSRPVVTGRATLTGAAELPALGIHLTDLRIDASGTGANAVRVDAGARSGKGTLRLSGDARPDARGHWSARLQIRGQDFQVADIPSARVSVSPDLELRTAGRDLYLDGSVAVVRARLDWQPPPGVVHSSPDVVLVGERTRPPPAWRVHARVRLILGDHTELRALGFKGTIGGQLLAIDEPGKPTLGQGELKIRSGTFKAYGQELKLASSRLLFAGGPVDDPGLDLESVRTVGDVTVGIHVRGTARHPTLSLFSSPSMAQSDILSYLLLGRPINQVSTAQGSALSSAATGLGLGGANLLLGRVGSLLDLQEAQIQTGSLTPSTAPPPGLPPAVANALAPSTAPSTSLVLGKYLSPRLYVQYATSLFQPGNIFRLRYKLSRRWSVSTETGIESGIDFLYTIER